MVNSHVCYNDDDDASRKADEAFTWSSYIALVVITVAAVLSISTAKGRGWLVNAWNRLAAV